MDRIKVGDRMLTCLAMPGLTGNEARVLAALAWHDGSGKCWPADDTIAVESGVRLRGSVWTARQGLKRKGRLRRDSGEHTNVYQIAYGEPFAFGHCPGNSDSALSGNLTTTVRETRTRTGRNRTPASNTNESRAGTNRRSRCRSAGIGTSVPRVGNFTASATSSRRAPKPAWSAGTAATCRTIGGVGPRTYAMA